jgi:predicted nuclease of restriction endonuclease-like RecB superfamily
MLTADLAMSYRRGDTVTPRHLNPADPRHLETAGGLVEILREHSGRSRAEVDLAFDELIGSGTDYRVIRGMIKLLLDRCVFETSSPVEPGELRRAVFAAAARRHPIGLDGEARAAALAEVAAELHVPPPEIERSLYADLPSSQRLAAFDDLDARELLDAYNVAQAQALLYRAVRMVIDVAPQPAVEYRRLFDAIKAHRLVHIIHGDAAAGYEIVLDGPVSMFHRSQKYGVQMAVFLPSLLACSGWRMRAEIDLKPRGTAFYTLDASQTRLRAPETPSGGRHPVVEKILSVVAQTGGSWAAEPCRDVVAAGGEVFVPDVVARTAEGRSVWIEVLGFWTPRHVERRLAELDRGGIANYLLLASDELRASRDGLDPTSRRVLVFKSSPDARSIRTALESFRT